MVWIHMDTFHGTHLLALWLIEVADALGTEFRRDEINLLAG
jgi:hypothetical protein